MAENSSSRIFGWFLEYMCKQLHNEFLESSTVDGPSDRDFLNGFLHHLAPKHLTPVQSCMVQYLYLLVRLVDGPKYDEQLTPLEDAVEILNRIVLYDEDESIPRIIVSQFKELISREAILVCCRRNDFEKAKVVVERLWPENANVASETEKEAKSGLMDMVNSGRRTHVDIRKSSYADFIINCHQYLLAIYATFPVPFLVKADDKFLSLFKRREGDNQVDMSEIRNARTSTGNVEECTPKSKQLRRVIANFGEDPEKIMTAISRDGEKIHGEVINKIKQYVRAQSAAPTEVMEQGDGSWSSESDIFVDHPQRRKRPVEEENSHQTPPKQGQGRRKGLRLSTRQSVGHRTPKKHSSQTSRVSPRQSVAPGTPEKHSSPCQLVAPGTPEKHSSQPCRVSTRRSVAPGTPKKHSSPCQSVAPGTPEKRSSPRQSVAPGTPEKRSSPRQSVAPGTPEKHTSPRRSVALGTSEKHSSPHRSVAPGKPTKHLFSKEDAGEQVQWDSDSDDEEVVYPVLRTPTFHRNLCFFRRPPRSWSVEETNKLIAGVKRFGVGHWAKVRENCDLPHRSSVDIKDKWRNLKKKHLV